MKKAWESLVFSPYSFLSSSNLLQRGEKRLFVFKLKKETFRDSEAGRFEVFIHTLICNSSSQVLAYPFDFVTLFGVNGFL